MLIIHFSYIEANYNALDSIHTHLKITHTHITHMNQFQCTRLIYAKLKKKKFIKT